MCIVLTNLPVLTMQALNLLTSDTPDAPINVTAEESPDSDPNDDSCMLVIDLRPPSNIDMNHIKHYCVQFPSGNRTIPNTGTGCIKVPNCTQDIRLNVSAVNSCDIVGASASDIEPMFITTSTPTTSAATTDSSTGPGSESSPTSAATTDSSTGPGSESSSTLVSTTLCAVLLVISVLSS